ncbi:hypothetical protein GLYMA_12G080600v4 [Glycine max]|nr:hypothetical protein GLYMA_12G080600v4 [Glycine max]KAG4385379.1 hypothetical protein GLYMA_12G080600v4 [Glycine max]KAH1142200.1 hypothetical protein GYH30_033055 [Glycine max]
MDTNDPLDFEVEDDLLKCPPINNKRKKIIGLDDLLKDHYIEQDKLLEKRNKQKKKAKTKAKKIESSYDDEDSKEARLTRIVEKCHNQLTAFGEEQEIPPWGVKVFGDKKAFPPLESPDLGSCNLLQSFLNNKLNSMVELTADKVLYSSKEELCNSSSDFWCAILSSEKEVDQAPVKVDWFPEYMDIRRALDIYGFLFKFSSSAKPNNLDSDIEGPPQNIRAWIRCVTACCLIRSKKAIFSTVEAEEIVEIIICLFLDRQFQGLLVLLNDCMEAIVNYFTDQEWCSSCENIAKFIACRVSKDLNCIQTIECISEANSRCKQLRSAVAYQTLLSCFDGVNSGEEILRSLTQINFKDKNCDFYNMYIHLVLTENWVLSNSLIEDNPVIYEMFSLYLQHCSTLISATNLRSYASKVRHRASYLLHFSIYK